MILFRPCISQLNFELDLEDEQFDESPAAETDQKSKYTEQALHKQSRGREINDKPRTDQKSKDNHVDEDNHDEQPRGQVILYTCIY